MSRAILHDYYRSSASYRVRIALNLKGIDWVIVGGESGKSARPMQLDWARSLQRQSASLGRVFNFKQVGGRGSDKGGHSLDGRVHFDRPKIAA